MFDKNYYSRLLIFYPGTNIPLQWAKVLQPAYCKRL
jgi:hypothetical protein